MDSNRKLARTALIDSEGREVYEKLLRSLAGYVESEDRRLRYWQEAVLARLEANASIRISRFEEAVDLLLVCDVHGQPIAWSEGRKVSGEETRHSEEYVAAENELFPHSQEVVWVAGPVPGARTIRVLSCPGCLEARRRWAGQLPNNSSKPTPLRGAA